MARAPSRRRVVAGRRLKVAEHATERITGAISNSTRSGQHGRGRRQARQVRRANALLNCGTSRIGRLDTPSLRPNHPRLEALPVIWHHTLRTFQEPSIQATSRGLSVPADRWKRFQLSGSTRLAASRVRRGKRWRPDRAAMEEVHRCLSGFSSHPVSS